MSDRHDSLDRGVRVIALEPEVVVAEIENILYIWIQCHARKGSRLPAKLLMHLVKVIQIDMGIAESMDKVAGSRPHTCAIICVRSA